MLEARYANFVLSNLWMTKPFVVVNQWRLYRTRYQLIYLSWSGEPGKSPGKYISKREFHLSNHAPHLSDT